MNFQGICCDLQNINLQNQGYFTCYYFNFESTSYDLQNIAFLNNEYFTCNEFSNVKDLRGFNFYSMSKL